MTRELLADFVDASKTLRRTRVPLPPLLERVVIVGATCVGKTTVAHAVRNSPAAAERLVRVPVRYVTRPLRRNDCLVENRHVTHEEFERLARLGAIDTHWRRRLDRDREHRYGFAPTPAGALAVYSGNNALLEDSSDLCPVSALDHALFLGLYAPDEVRVERLERRSPDLVRERPSEVAARLADKASRILAHVHVVVENHGDGEEDAPGEVARLVELVAESRLAVRSR